MLWRISRGRAKKVGGNHMYGMSPEMWATMEVQSPHVKSLRDATTEGQKFAPRYASEAPRDPDTRTL